MALVPAVRGLGNGPTDCHMGAQLEWRTVADVPEWLKTICVSKGLVSTVLVYKQTHCSACLLGLVHGSEREKFSPHGVPIPGQGKSHHEDTGMEFWPLSLRHTGSESMNPARTQGKSSQTEEQHVQRPRVRKGPMCERSRLSICAGTEWARRDWQGLGLAVDSQAWMRA